MSKDNKIVTMDGKPMTREMEIKDFLKAQSDNCAEYNRCFVYMGSTEGNVQDSMAWVGMTPIEAIGVITVISNKMSGGM